MKIFEIPHNTADYQCPVNGLCDIYEWKTGVRIPEELVSYVRTGFMLISQKRVNPPKMIFMMSMSIGKRLFEFWSGRMGYRLIASEGKTFKNALSDIKALIDIGIPVILFGLDMFYLAYHDKFYNKIHIPGHVVLMVGYDENAVYVVDNSKIRVQAIPYSDLEMAWKENYFNISKRNAYFGIDFLEVERNTACIMQKAYKDISHDFLNPKVGFYGIKGIDKWIKEFPKWNKQYDSDILKTIYTHHARFSGSVLPELPAGLDKNQSQLINPHRGMRDKLASSLTGYRELFGNMSWELASKHLNKSGEIIEKTVNEFASDILRNCYQETDKYMDLLRQLREYEKKAYMEII